MPLSPHIMPLSPHIMPLSPHIMPQTTNIMGNQYVTRHEHIELLEQEGAAPFFVKILG